MGVLVFHQRSSFNWVDEKVTTGLPHLPPPVYGINSLYKDSQYD